MVHELTRKLMMEMGLDINEQNVVIDQDFANVIMFNGKYMKCSYDEKEPFVGKNDIYFDPMNNHKIMMTLFSYYMHKLNHSGGIYFNSFYPIPAQDGKTCLEAKGDKVVRSNFYFNECLKYIDLIFKLEGNENVNLSIYDYQYQVR